MKRLLGVRFGPLAILTWLYVLWSLVPVLIGATLVHIPNGWLFTSANGGWEYPAFLAVASAVQALLGDGPATLLRSERLLPQLRPAQA